MRNAGFWLLFLCFADVMAQTSGGCDDFRWDVARERALFASAEGLPLQAGSDAAEAPDLLAGELYEVVLQAQEDVQLVVPPSKAMLAEGTYAGVLRLRIPAAGRYRIALDSGAWMDVVDAGSVINSSEFSGALTCTKPAKIVLYDLPQNATLYLQLTGSASDRVRVSVVPHNDAQ
ncbi:MAG: hypothetical protein IT475_10560 [Aquimonas sp.]|nr:hypothetical protein [Xanthomonadales bacterium]MCC6505876.1 hypothetical protein [Aquimonas sp.]